MAVVDLKTKTVASSSAAIVIILLNISFIPLILNVFFEPCWLPLRNISSTMLTVNVDDLIVVANSLTSLT